MTPGSTAAVTTIVFAEALILVPPPADSLHPARYITAAAVLVITAEVTAATATGAAAAPLKRPSPLLSIIPGSTSAVTATSVVRRAVCPSDGAVVALALEGDTPSKVGGAAIANGSRGR
jgi:hypothetical protein